VGEHFRYEPDPDHPGWHRWHAIDETRFNFLLAPLRTRLEEGPRARVRMIPVLRHSNFSHRIHGGVLLGFADIALFSACRVLGVADTDSGVTVECSMQFLDAGHIDEPLDALVEVMRETRRMVFLRGTMVQDDRRVAAFSGILRKGNR